MPVPDVLARKIFERDNYTCQGCQRKGRCALDLGRGEFRRLMKSGEVLVIDHKDSRSNDESNLQALCVTCNSLKAGKSQHNFRLSVALKTLGPCMTYYPAVARLLGLHEAIFLCQLVYWTPRGRHEKGDGWIYKSAEEMEFETGLTYKQQIRLRKRLSNLKLLEEMYNREEHRLYFRVSADELDRLGNHVTNGHMPKGQVLVDQLPESQVAYDQRESGTLPLVSSYKEAEITAETTQRVLLPTPKKDKQVKGTVFPEGLQPSETNKTLARELGVNLRIEWPKFRDHHLAKGTIFKNWHAAANNWIRRAQEYAKTNGTGNHTVSADPSSDILTRLRAQTGQPVDRSKEL